MANERSFASLGAKLNDLNAAWTDRLKDAETLRLAARYSTAITMGLYALEIRLKVRICQKLDLPSLPRPFEIHDLEGLLIVGGLRKPLNMKNARHVKANWTKLKETAKGLNELRYQSGLAKNQQESDDFFDQLIDPNDGVLPWISTQN
jgi:hypothetical protein